MTTEQHFTFGTPGKGTFTKVKDASNQSLCDRNGADARMTVGVYLRKAGTPEFCIQLPPEYAEVWEHHAKPANHQSLQHRKAGVMSGIVASPTFEGALDGLIIVAMVYGEYIRTRTMEKVISLEMRLSVPWPQAIQYQPPSFDQSRYLIALTSNILYLVNGRYYKHSPFDKSKNHENPEFKDLHPTHPQIKNLTIPYTDAAWQTIQAVEATLAKAARMLHGLLDDDRRVLMLNSGIEGMMALTPPAPVAPAGEENDD